MTTHLNAIRAAGVGQVRTDSGWHLAEPRAPVGGVHSYDWAYSDRVTAALAGAGLAWYALLDYGTPWAARIPGDPFAPPRDVADFAAYAAAFARRYARGGEFWRAHPGLPAHPVTTIEVWNEPNVVGFWHPFPDPALYAQMLAATADAAGRVDPALRIVVGGLANTGPSLVDAPPFLDGMLAARPDLRGKVDGVGIHDYNTTTDATVARVRAIRGLVDRLLGPDVTLDITEVGWATAGVLPSVLVPAAVTEGTRAALYVELVDRMTAGDCTIGSIAPYAWLTPEGLEVNQNDFFGIADRSAALKPSGVAFRDAVARAQSRPVPPAPLSLCGRPDARLPDVAIAPEPLPAPALAIRGRAAPRSACRRGRPLLRVTTSGGAQHVRVRIGRGRFRRLTVPAGGDLRVRLPAGARRVTLVAEAGDGREARRTVTVRTRCPRAGRR